MVTKCPRCDKTHESIFIKFSNYLNPEQITHEDCKEFLKMAKSEISNNKFNELFCITSSIISQNLFLKSSNKFANLLWQECIILNEIISKDPSNSNLESLEKLIYQYTESKMDTQMPFRIKKDMDNTELETEYKKIIRGLIGARDNKDLRDQLLNYTILRMVSFYERWIHDTLVKEINELPPESLHIILEREIRINRDDIISSTSLSVGKIGVLNLDNGPYALNSIIQKLLKAKYYNQKSKFNGKSKQIWTNEKFNFFSLVDDVLLITDAEMSQTFEEFGSWYKLITNVNSQRNLMIHELGNVEYPPGGIELIFEMYHIFVKVFPNLLKLILNAKNSSVSESEKKSLITTLHDDASTFKLKSYESIIELINEKAFSSNSKNK